MSASPLEIALYVNEVASEHPLYTTTLLAEEAVRRGHRVGYVEPSDFVYAADGSLQTAIRWVPESFHDGTEMLEHLADAEARRYALESLDLLLLRADPAREEERPWARDAGVLFGQMAAHRGVLVLNDPSGLTGALNKLYFQYFPEGVRPATLITRDAERIRRFAEEGGDRVVIKPLQGSGGQSVFLLEPDDRANWNQMIEAVLRDGYVIAQEYLPAATEGDVRLFLLDGRPLVQEGEVAAFRRINESDDPRTNMHAGGEAVEAELRPRHLELAELVRPRLRRDGMFFVGLDIAGDKILEINVFSPGGLNSATEILGIPFVETIVDSLERKIAHRRRYPDQFTNAQLATL
ncbi:MAG: glutathione synthase [Thermoanaerobaculia bacterium]|nr:glutathione synthase [Thermoanaerobaculia bacterium]